MNWEAIGAIGEVVGAAAVVITLLYLAIQTRANTRAIAASSAREVYLARSLWNRALATDSGLNQLGYQAMQPELKDFSGEEWHRFMAYSFAYFDILQADYVNYDLGVGYSGVRSYESVGFIHESPAWKYAFELWAESGSVEPGLVEAIRSSKQKFPNILVPPSNGST